MKKTLKWAIGLPLAVIALVLIGAAVLLFAVDPNQYKPQLEQLAKDNQVKLNINGDLSWQLWPDVAITIADTRIHGQQLPDIHIQQADLALELASLIRGELAVKKIAVDKPLVQLELTDSNAGQKAAAIAATPTATQATPANTAEQAPTPLAIDNLSVTNGTLELLENGRLKRRLNNLTVASQGINLENRGFPIQLAFTTTIKDEADRATVELTASVLNENLQRIVLQDGKLELTANSSEYGNHKASIGFTAELDLLKDTLALSQANARIDDIPLTLTASVKDLSKTPVVDGQLSIPNFDPSNLLATLAPDSPAINQLALDAQFNISGDDYQVSQLALVVDDFTLNGELSANLSAQRKINAQLNGTQLNLDRYFPETETETQKTEQPATPNQAVFAPLLAPLAALQGGRGQIEFSLNQLTASGVQLDNLRVNTFGNGQVLQLASASANGFGGTLSANARIDMAPKEPTLAFAVAGKSVDLGQALSTLADFNELSGRGNLEFSGTTQGNSGDALSNNIKGSGNFAMTNGHYSATNIEQQFCAVAGDKNQQPESWQPGTQLNNTAGTFALNGQTLTLQSLNSGVGNLTLRSQGNLQLQDQLMDLHVVLAINNPKSSEQGCVLRSKSIQNRDIPLHLKGPVADINGVMTNAMTDLITRTLLDRQKQRLLDKLLGSEQPQESEQTPEQTPEQQPPQNSKDQLKGLLKDLLKKR
ncbi:AsmA family protein [bacterium SCSIO 12696]|nr:AsmA family protein [bacterium SCSIO 12696]